MKHIIDLWSGYWFKQLSKTNEAVDDRNRHKKVAGNTWLVFFQIMSFRNLLGAICLQLSVVRKNEIFGRVIS